VGDVLRESGLARDQVFVTTKLQNRDHGYERARRALDESLQDLKLDHVDLYLLHWPVEGLRLESWRALEEALAAGKARAIGVSNFLPRHLDELLAAASVTPAVDQVECSPFLVQRDLRDYCSAHGIQVEAYSPLTRGRRLDEPAVVSVAAEHGKTPAQVLIRWALQHELVVIPKSVTRERLLENADVFDFELSAPEMAALDDLDEGAHYAWDPTNVP
jgi:methylglyoxal/glyoxal reductase